MSGTSNAGSFAAKLREEIEQGQGRRHDYCCRKLTLSTGLLGVGALSVSFKGAHVDLSSLLWLVPFVALAYDLYIVSEDHGVKRAGAFLGSPRSGASAAERRWETDFVQRHLNPFASFASYLASLVLVSGALLVLAQVGAPCGWLALWSMVAVAAETALLLYSLFLRDRFRHDVAADARHRS